jgi:heterodisulfide reductase subunit C2
MHRSLERREKMTDSSFLREMEAITGQPISLCYQCKKCSGGCPVSSVRDIQTNEIIRLVQLGQKDKLLESGSIWLCIGCKTCSARCPNKVNGSKVMDALKSLALKDRKRIGDPHSAAFHDCFLTTVEYTGRLYDLAMVGMYKMKTGTFFADLKLGMELGKRGKMPILPHRIHRLHEVKEIFRKARVKIV